MASFKSEALIDNAAPRKAILFTGQLLRVPVTQAVSVLFIAAMGVLVAALLSFLLEIRISSRTLRVAGELLKPRS